MRAVCLPCFGLLSSFSYNGLMLERMVLPDLVFCHKFGFSSLSLAYLLQTSGPAFPPSLPPSSCGLFLILLQLLVLTQDCGNAA